MPEWWMKCLDEKSGVYLRFGSPPLGFLVPLFVPHILCLPVLRFLVPFQVFAPFNFIMFFHSHSIFSWEKNDYDPDSGSELGSENYYYYQLSIINYYSQNRLIFFEFRLDHFWVSFSSWYSLWFRLLYWKSPQDVGKNVVPKKCASYDKSSFGFN